MTLTPPLAPDEAAEEAELEAEPEEFICGPCQRNKHRRCRSPECRCCYGGDDELDQAAGSAGLSRCPRADARKAAGRGRKCRPGSLPNVTHGGRRAAPADAVPALPA